MPPSGVKLEIVKRVQLCCSCCKAKINRLLKILVYFCCDTIYYLPFDELLKRIKNQGIYFNLK